MEQNKEIQQLYYRYKRRDDEEIRKDMEKMPIVKLMNKGVGTVQGYYPLNDACIAKISKKPRNVSLTFDVIDTADQPLTGLKVYKELTYLVKSSSRFFLKPDVGEIMDQIEFSDRWSNEIKAICFLPDSYETLDGTDGEHFLMKALLLTNDNG